MVPEAGIEPARDYVPSDFESDASASSTTPAPYALLAKLRRFCKAQHLIPFQSTYQVVLRVHPVNTYLLLIGIIRPSPPSRMRGSGVVVGRHVTPLPVPLPSQGARGLLPYEIL